MAIASYIRNGQTLWRATAKCRDRSGRQISRKQSNLPSEAYAKRVETKLKVELLTMRDGNKRYRWEE